MGELPQEAAPAAAAAPAVEEGTFRVRAVRNCSQPTHNTEAVGHPVEALLQPETERERYNSDPKDPEVIVICAALDRQMSQAIRL